MRLSKKRLASWATAAVITTFGTLLSAAEYPRKPITLIVPSAPGGGVDSQARALAPALEEYLGQPVIIVNKKGAGGTIGIQQMMASKSDGYTIAAAASVQFIQNPIVQGLQYGVDDLSIIGTTGMFQTALVAAGSAPYDTWDEFVTYARENPGSKWYSVGKITATIMKTIADKEGLDINIVPGQGGATIAPTLIAGDADIGFSGGIHANFLPTGELKVLLSTLSEGKLMATPEVPSSLERYGVTLDNRLVIVAPKGVPADIIEKLSAATKVAAQSERYGKLMSTLQYPVTYLNATDSTARYLEAEARDKKLLAN